MALTRHLDTLPEDDSKYLNGKGKWSDPELLRKTERAIAYRSTTLSISSTVVDVPFDTEVEDPSGRYNDSTGVFTVQQEGMYEVDLVINVSGFSSGDWVAAVISTSRVVLYLYEHPTSGNYKKIGGTLKRYFYQGDSIKVRLVCSSGASGTMLAANGHNQFSVCYRSP